MSLKIRVVSFFLRLLLRLTRTQILYAGLVFQNSDIAAVEAE